MSSTLPREVPAHDVIQWAQKTQRHCVAVFVINEGKKILSQLSTMKPWHGLVDVVLADGGSTDGSVSEDTLRPLGVNTLLVKTGTGRLGSQMRMAFDWALTRGYEGIITMDGNGKDDPKALASFVEALDEGFDHVQGSRFIAGGHHAHTPKSRLLGIKLLHAPLISRAAGFRYTDTTNGFRAYSRRLLEDHRVAPFRNVFEGYELHYYLAIRAAELGFRVCEVPVTRVYPDGGPVPTKISPLLGNAAVLKKLWAACRHRYDPPAGASP